MKFYYERLEHNALFWTLEKNPTICKALAYLLTFEEYTSFTVQPKLHSIEVKSKKFTISILLFVGYEKTEFLDYEKESNLHIVSFDQSSFKIEEFQVLKPYLKFIQPQALFFTALEFSDNPFCNDLKTILDIR